MCSKWILHQKSHFHPITRIPKFSLLPLLLCHKTVRGPYSKGVKSIFETPHNERKCVLSIIESYSIEKNASTFSHLLTVKADGADPSPPYGQPDRKTFVCFFTSGLTKG